MTSAIDVDRVGVFVCHCGLNIAASVDVDAVVAQISKYPGVEHAQHYIYNCSDPGQNQVRDAIRGKKLNGIIMANCSPSLHQGTFRRLVASEGLNPFHCEIANIREQCSWPHGKEPVTATLKAIAIIKATIEKVRRNLALVPPRIPVTRRALVIGGGIAGMQAALDIADTGYEVVLVEREPHLGGQAAKISGTFLTLEWSPCAMAGRIARVVSHPKIKLYTSSDLEEIGGFIGNFIVKIRCRQASAVTGHNVIPAKAGIQTAYENVIPAQVGIHTASENVIPAKAGIQAVSPAQGSRTAGGEMQGSGSPSPPPSPSMRERDKSVSPLPPAGGRGQSLPRACRGGEVGKHSSTTNPFENAPGVQRDMCLEVRPESANNSEQTHSIVEEKVGAVIVATGYDLYPKDRVPEYESDPDVLDGLQFERLLSPTGPTGGVPRRPSDGRVPKDIVFVKCVGSRDPERGVPYCSKVCCMYTAKQALYFKRMVPAGKVYVFYMDIRATGKGYEEFVKRATEEAQITYIRGRVSRIFREGEKLMVWGTDTLTGKAIEIPADMVVLATAIVPAAGTKELARKLNILTDAAGFVSEAHIKLRPVETLTAGIFLGGTIQGPKDIPDTTMQAGGAAAKVISLFTREALERDPAIAVVDEEVCAGCGYCERACTYKAPTVDPITRISHVNEAICEGCGACAVACPSGAMQLKNMDNRQIFEMIDVMAGEY